MDQNDTPPAGGEEIDLFSVKATVTDTRGVNVAPGEQFNNTYITGPTKEASIDQFRQLCGAKGFEIDSELEVTKLSREDVIEILAGERGDIVGSYSEYE